MVDNLKKSEFSISNPDKGTHYWRVYFKDNSGKWDLPTTPWKIIVPHSIDNTSYGPIPYLSFDNSPFLEMSKASKYFHLKNFEDGSINTFGAIMKQGELIIPEEYNDSVDIDDGYIDGKGNNQFNVKSESNDSTIFFTFDQEQLLEYPNYAGIVFTDCQGGYHKGEVTFEAYSAEDGSVIDKIGPSLLGDGKLKGETDEDRFFGIVYDGGIKGIKLSAIDSCMFIEADHLQYGFLNP